VPLLLAGCAAGPARRDAAAVKVAAEYGRGESEKNAPVDAVRFPTSVSSRSPQTVSGDRSVSEDRWWQGFGDARLNRLVDAMLSANTDLATAGLRLKQARLLAGLAADAGRPHLDATTSFNYDRLLKAPRSDSRASSATASVSYEADLWGKLRAQREIATWEVEATVEDLQATKLLLVGDACNLYWTLAFLNQRISNGEQSLTRLQRTLALVQSQFTSGAVSRLEVREAEQNLESQKTLQSQLIQRRVELRNALTVLLDGHPWPTSDEPQNLDDTRSPEIQPGLPVELLARRPDLRASELRLRQALKSIKVAQASYYPVLSLTGGVGGSSAALRDVLANPIATLGAGLVFPFLHWNEMNLNVELAGTDYEIEANNFRKALYRAFADVDNALSARAQLIDQLSSSQKSFDAAVEIERLYEVRYRSGAASLRFWLDAQETRRSAELVLAQARLNQLQNDVVLSQALGGSARMGP
jgi:NodT family efflux transporter outer membrane factor (OMF) lipoprotein